MLSYHSPIPSQDFQGANSSKHTQIPNRTQFKHVLFGPQLWSGYDEAYFPSIRDTVDSGDWGLANRTIAKVADIIKRAAANLAEGTLGV